MRIGDFEIPLLSVPLPQDLTTFRYSFSDRALYHANPAYNGTFKIECTDTSPSKVTAISPTTKSSMANGNMSCLGYLQNMRKQLDEYRNKFKSHSATDEDTLKCAEKRLENAILQVKKLAKERGFVDEQKGEDNHADNTPRP